MENKLFLLQEPGAPAGGGTKIVLNRQSDLILTDAQIVAPVGIVEADIDGLIPHLASVESDVAAETKARIANDEKLTDDLSSEQADRIKADNELQSSINVEKGRIDAILDGSDVNLDQFVEVVNFVQAIDLENDASLLGAVASIETKHDAEVSAEISNREDAVDKLNEKISDSIKKESEARETADTSLEQAMGEYVDSSMKKEQAERGEADNSLEELITSEIKTEIAARQEFDSYLEQKIDKEVTRARNEDDKHDNEINEIKDDVKSLESADASLEELIGSHVETLEDEATEDRAARVSADLSLEQAMGEYVDSSMKKEQAERGKADNELQASINVEKGRIDAILDGSDVNLDQFSEVVAFVQGIDLENDQALLGAITSIESKHDAEVSAEISNREDAVAKLDEKMGEHVDSSIKKEQAERGKADASLEELIASEIKTEIAARQEFDSYLEQKIDEEVTRAKNEDDKHDNEINAINVSISDETSTRQEIDEAIKAGVNAALVEIKDMIMNAARQASFRLLAGPEGDGVETTFDVGMYGHGAIYLNGLLQHQGVDYSTNTTIDGKGNPSVAIIFDEAPANGSQITIYGQEAAVKDDNWFGDITPITFSSVIDEG